MLRKHWSWLKITLKLSCTQGAEVTESSTNKQHHLSLKQNVCRASDAIRSGTRYAKWAGGSRSQTHRRAPMGGFTQDDGYVRGVAPTHDFSSGSFSRASPTADRPNPIFLYNWVLDTDTGTGPIPPITVSRVNAYSGAVCVLARALPEGLRYLST